MPAQQNGLAVPPAKATGIRIYELVAMNVTQSNTAQAIAIPDRREQAVERHIQVHGIVPLARIEGIWGEKGLQVAAQYRQISYGPKAYVCWEVAS